MMHFGLKERLVLIVGTVFLCSYAILAFFDYRNIKSNIEEGFYNEARSINELLFSVRSVYSQQFSSSGLQVTEKSVGFLPAHAMGRISKEFTRRSHTGIRFINVSDRPRNPDHQADKIELEAIRFFKQDRDAEDRWVTYEDPEWGPSFHFSSPIWVTRSCLRCHGEKEQAPAWIQQNYDQAYGYKIGDIRGIVSIKVSGKRLDEALASHLKNAAYSYLAGFVITFSLLLLTFQRSIVERFKRLRHAVSAVRSGDYSQHLEDDAGDEISDVLNTFNLMAEQIASREQMLIDSRRRIQTILEGSGDGIMLVDHNGKVMEINPTGCHMFGYEVGVFKDIDLSRLMPEEYQKLHNAAFIASVNNPGEKLDYSKSMEVEGVKASGERFPLELTISKTLYNDKPVFIAVMRDITKRRKEDEELAQTRQKYFHQEKMAAVGQLAAGVLHEVGNPIAAINGALEYLQSLESELSEKANTGACKEVITYLKMIREQTDRLSVITRDMAGYVANRAPEKEVFDLNSLIERSSGLLQFDRRLKYIDVEFNYDRTIPAVYGVQDQIVQIFMNLVINAGHACEASSNRPSKITVATGTEKDEYVYMAITDNGVGMDDLVMHRSREAFFTTKSAEVGTGLGLSLCDSIIEAHGGRMDIESELGKGTTIKIMIPFF